MSASVVSHMFSREAFLPTTEWQFRFSIFSGMSSRWFLLMCMGCWTSVSFMKLGWSRWPSGSDCDAGWIIDALGGRVLGDEPLFGDDVAWGLLKLISGSSDLLLASAEIESNWLDVSKSVKSKRQEEKFGRPHWTHSQDILLRAKYIWSGIPIQSWWYQILQESHCTPGVVHFTAFWHTPHGNLGCLGPGLGSGA